MACALDILLIDEGHLPHLRHPLEDTARGRTEITLCEEDRRIVLDGLRDWVNSEETRAAERNKPQAAEAVYDKIWTALHKTNDGPQFTEWRRDYSKGAKSLAMAIAMTGSSRK